MRDRPDMGSSDVLCRPWLGRYTNAVGFAIMPDVDENVLWGTSVTSIRMRMSPVRSAFILPPQLTIHRHTKSGRPKRTVQCIRSNDMWAYMASGMRLPDMVSRLVLMDSRSSVQYNGMPGSHTRLDPPSIEVRFHHCRDTAHCC
jgi:hypothetical protein